MTRRSFIVLVGLPGIFKAVRHKPITITDAAMDPATGMLVVAVPVECQESVRVWLNGVLLQNKVHYRATLGGIYPLPGPYLVEWMAHRSRHKVVF